MKQTEVSVILSAIDTLKGANIESHKAIVKSIDDLSDHVKEMNGNVAELQRESIKRQKAVDDFRELEKRVEGVFGFCKRKWWTIIIIGVLFVVLVVIFYDFGYLTASGLFNLIFK